MNRMLVNGEVKTIADLKTSNRRRVIEVEMIYGSSA